MPETIEIPDELYALISKHAIPFVEIKPADVILRWAKHYEETCGKITSPACSDQVVTLAGPMNMSRVKRSENSKPKELGDKIELLKRTAKRYNWRTPPDLTHTKACGYVGMQTFSGWNDLVRKTHVQAHEKLGSLEKLIQISKFNVISGNHDGKNGFHFVPDINASIQGSESNKAWERSHLLASHCEIPIAVYFLWLDKDDAAFPGENGALELNFPNSKP